MSNVSNRVVQVEFSGIISSQVIQSALQNDVSPCQEQIVSLVTGANTITAPVVSGIVVTALTIILPSANTVAVTLKGVTGDTGIPLNLVDPTSIALASTFTSLVLTAADAVVGVRLVWS